MVAEDQPILSQPLPRLFDFGFFPAQVCFFPESACLTSVFCPPHSSPLSELVGLLFLLLLPEIAERAE